MAKLISSYIILSLLVGCTFVPTRSDSETNQAIDMPVPEGKSLIYIIRPSRYVMSGRHFDIFMNNISIGLLGSSHFYVVSVLPGKYLLTTQVTDHIIYDLVEGGSIFESINQYMYSDSEGVLVDAQAGKKYYVEVYVFLNAKLEVGDASVLEKGTFSTPSLVDIVEFQGKPLVIKPTGTDK